MEKTIPHTSWDAPRAGGVAKKGRPGTPGEGPGGKIGTPYRTGGVPRGVGYGFLPHQRGMVFSPELVFHPDPFFESPRARSGPPEAENDETFPS